MTKKAVIIFLSGIALMCLSVIASTDQQRFSDFVDANGNISLPENFRTTMVHLGSWFVPEGEASGFHDVYTEASTVVAYRKTGEFPDGATLVKELRHSAASDYTTGKGVSAATSEVKQWFVMIKDTRGRFPDNPIWGSGWGWALYKPDAPEVNVATNYRVDCLGCHIPAQADDHVYIDAYPTISDRRRFQ